jgi:hypothetical protein
VQLIPQKHQVPASRRRRRSIHKKADSMFSALRESTQGVTSVSWVQQVKVHAKLLANRAAGNEAMRHHSAASVGWQSWR